jgi:hypothetical protein
MSDNTYLNSLNNEALRTLHDQAAALLAAREREAKEKDDDAYEFTVRGLDRPLEYRYVPSMRSLTERGEDDEWQGMVDAMFEGLYDETPADVAQGLRIGAEIAHHIARAHGAVFADDTSGEWCVVGSHAKVCKLNGDGQIFGSYENAKRMRDELAKLYPEITYKLARVLPTTPGER